MSKAPVAVIHTVGSLTPNSGVTPVISNSLGYRQAAGQQARCVAFSDHYDATRWSGLTGALRLIERPRLPWQQYARFRDALVDEVTQQRQQGYSVVLHDHGMWLPSNLAASAVARDLNCPIIVSPHGMLQPEALNTSKAKKFLAWHLVEQRRLRQAQMVLAASAMEAQAIKLQLSARDVRTCPLGVEVDDLQVVEAEDRPKVVLFLGRLHPIKGLDLALRAWSEIAAESEWTLKIAGPGDPGFVSELRSLAEQLKIAGRVEFTGPLHGEAKKEALNKSAVLILPSRSENFGLVICEALAHGTPVITTSTTPWADVERLGCGWIAEPSVQGLAACLSAAINTPMPTLQAMGHAGWSWMKSSFDLPVVARQMNDCYEELGHA